MELSMSTPSLKELQSQLFASISEGKSLSSLLNWVQEDRGIDRQARVEAYRRSSLLGQLDVLKEDFEVTCEFLGQAKGDELLQNYLRKHPSHTHFINEIGREFPKYLEENLPAGAEDFLLDLAKLEWLMVESFYSFTPFQLRTSPARSSETTQVQTQHSLILFQSPWPIDEIWTQREVFDRQESYISVWTKGSRQIFVESWGRLEYEVLLALQQSSSLEQAVAKVEDKASTEELSHIFGRCLAQWSEMELLAVELF